jgi:hypothetical protein
MKTNNMIQVNLIAALLAIFSFAIPAYAGSLEPSAPPGPTMKTLDEVEPRIPITTIPFTIDQPGSYYLTNDLTTAASGILVESDDVTIDLMGYRLMGMTNGIGISVSANNVEIRNGVIRRFDHGIFGGGKNNRIINIRSIDNNHSGIWLEGQNHFVKNCTASDNGSDSPGNFGNDIGIFIRGASTLIGNIASNNVATGIWAKDTSLVDKNTSMDNGGYNIGPCSTCTFGLNHAP